MKQSLPDIVAIYQIPCDSLVPNITEKYRAHLPIEISASLTSIEHYGNASCEAEQEYEGGGYSEKTTLQFSTAEEIRQFPPLAFVITDAGGQSYIIGTKEKPYPMIEMAQTIDKDKNVNIVKVTFTRAKSLVPCMM